MLAMKMMRSMGNTSPLLVGAQTCAATLEIKMVISQKVRNQSTSNPDIPLLGIYQKDVLPYHMGVCSTMFIASSFVIFRNGDDLICRSNAFNNLTLGAG